MKSAAEFPVAVVISLVVVLAGVISLVATRVLQWVLPVAAKVSSSSRPRSSSSVAHRPPSEVSVAPGRDEAGIGVR
jgi:hypothetical protein